jgi:hypothetical protein
MDAFSWNHNSAVETRLINRRRPSASRVALRDGTVQDPPLPMLCLRGMDRKKSIVLARLKQFCYQGPAPLNFVPEHGANRILVKRSATVMSDPMSLCRTVNPCFVGFHAACAEVCATRMDLSSQSLRRLRRKPLHSRVVQLLMYSPDLTIIFWAEGYLSHSDIVHPGQFSPRAIDYPSRAFGHWPARVERRGWLGTSANCTLG